MIELQPTKTIISNYDLGEEEKFERSLSVWDKIRYCYSFNAFKYEEETRSIIIPSGYDLDKLKNFFPYKKIIDNRKKLILGKINRFKMKFPTRDENQNKAINFLLTDSIQKFLCLPTGGGKTFCSIFYCQRIRKLPITFVDTEGIALQWKENILKFTDIKEDEIVILSGIKSVEDILKKSKKELEKIKWYIAMHRTFSNVYNKGILKDFFEKTGIGIRLYDEAHVEYKNIFLMDTIYNIESIYITATPSRSNPLENIVYQNMFKNVPKFIVKEEKYHNCILLGYNSNPEKADEARCQTKLGFSINTWSSFICNEGKYKIFEKSLERLLKIITRGEKQKIIIFAATLKMCDLIKESTEKIFKDSNYTIGMYNSKVKNKENELTKDIIITTEKSFGKAKDLKGLTIAINTIPLSSEVLFNQIIGRLRKIDGTELYYVDLYDEGFSSIKKQLTTRMRFYKKKCKKILKMK